MSYKILPTKEFSKDFKKIKHRGKQETIKRKIEEISENPVRYKRLHYDLSGSFRVRVGPFRIIYSINEDKKEMYLEKIVFDHRYKK